MMKRKRISITFANRFFGDQGVPKLREKLLVIGGVAAGLAAAMQARRLAPDLEITVIEKSGDISYGACGIPYVISGLIPSLDQLIVHSPEYFLERHNIDLRLHTEAIEVFPAKSVVRTSANKEEQELGYSQLVIATGAAAVCPPLPGHDLDGIFVIRHLNDARRMLDYIERVRPRTAVVVGAGYIGLEMAEAFSARGLRTTVVEASTNVMTTLGGALCERVTAEMQDHGVEMNFGGKVVGFEGSAGQVSKVATETGRVVEADIIAIGVGVRPNVTLAHSAGLELGDSGAIRTDAEQRTSVRNIFAAGDCCEVIHRISGRGIWFPLGQPAVKQGWTAGENAAGGKARYAGVVGTNVVKVFDLELARTGLSLAEAIAAGFEASAVESKSASRAGYYPGGSEITTCLVYDRRGRLLGAQMVGREGVAHRIDVYAAALHSSVTVDEVVGFDLAYAPPFAPTIDPIIRAAHKASKK
jgi:NADPH-dependent 2,4-dienoyl-CoA reductase/sulfur reductase-like enzyme